MNVQELEYLLVLEFFAFEFDWFLVCFNDEKRWEFLDLVLLGQSILRLPDQTELKSLFKVVAESLVNKWCSLLSIGKQEYLGCSGVLFNKSLVVVGRYFD